MLLIALAAAAAVSASPLGIDPKASVPLAPTAAEHAQGSCHVRIAANGMQLPDPACTPGAINPTLTVAVLTDKRFRTDMVRDKLTSAERKKIVYIWYGITPPSGNIGPDQVCEADHAVDLASGGADSLDNVWPQCEAGLSRAKPVGEREFKIKDRFAEHDVMRQAKAGGDLADLQRRIAADWTQFIPTETAAK